MRIREVFHGIGLAIHFDFDRGIRRGVFDIPLARLPMQVVHIEQVDVSFSEEGVGPKNDIGIIRDHQTDLTEFISFLNVVADDRGGIHVVSLTDASDQKLGSPHYQKIEDDHGGEGDEPIIDLHEVAESFWPIKVIKSDGSAQEDKLDNDDDKTADSGAVQSGANRI